MAFYSICGVTVEAETMPKCYQPFLLPEGPAPGKPGLTFRQADEPLPGKDPVKAAELPSMTVWKDGDPDNDLCWIYEGLNGLFTFRVDAAYSRAVFWGQEMLSFWGSGMLSDLARPVLQMILQCRLVREGITILHAACVELDGKAYAFTGPSGVGKSTRARKWADLLGAEWISGDRPAVDASKGTVYGAPWDGKEAVYRNVRRPLAAVLKVVRAEAAEVRQMPAEEKRQLLYEQAFIPMWDPLLAAAAAHQIHRMTDRIPILELRCGIADGDILASRSLLERVLNEGA